jgi:lysophospholipase L1-like esterase
MIKARIAAYGESTFKGYGNGTENDAYATPRLLQSARGVSVVDLDNLALSGVDLRSQMGFNGPKIQDYKLTDYYPAPLIAANIASHRGTITIVNVGINDAFIGFNNNTVAEFETNLSAVVDLLKHAGKLVFLQAPNKITIQAYKNGTTVNPVTGLKVTQALDAIAAKVSVVAANKGVLYQGTSSQSVPLLDGTHPTNAGYTTMANGLIGMVTSTVVNSMTARVATALLYIALFCRAPEKEGLDYWTGRIQAGLSFESGSCANTMLALPGVQAIYPPSMSNTDFVTQVYKNVFGRSPDPDGLTYWVGRLNAGISRGEVVSTMVDIGYNYVGTNPLGVKSQVFIQNRLSVGLAYGAIFGKTAIDGTGQASVLFPITYGGDYTQVATATADRRFLV